MEKLKLITLLKVFTKEDLKEAKKFLDSPFHNTDPQVRKLFSLLVKFHPDMDSPSLKSEHLFNLMFPRAAYDERKLRNLRHKLTHLLENYLRHATLSTEGNAGQRLLVQAFKRRNSFELFKKEIETAVGRLKASERQGHSRLEELAWLHHQLYFHPDANKSEANHPALFAAIECMEQFFSLVMLCYQAELNVRETLFRERRKSPFFEVVSQFAEQEPGMSLLRSLASEEFWQADKNQFEALKKNLFENHGKMGQFEASLALKMFINQEITRVNKGEPDAYPSLLSLFQFGLEHELATPQGNMDATWFVTVATTGANAGQFEWTAGFIENYQSKLGEEARQEAVNYSLAYNLYRSGFQNSQPEDYRKAAALLNELPYSNDLLFNLRIRTLQLRIEYDGHERGALPEEHIRHIVTNFVSFLHRHSNLAKDKLEGWRNFTRFYQKLVRLKMEEATTEQNLAAFEEELSTEKIVTFKRWIKEKTEELRQWLNG